MGGVYLYLHSLLASVLYSDVWVASRFGRLTFRKKASVVNRVGSCVSRTAGLDFWR